MQENANDLFMKYHRLFVNACCETTSMRLNGISCAASYRYLFLYEASGNRAQLDATNSDYGWMFEHFFKKPLTKYNLERYILFPLVALGLALCDELNFSCSVS
jgi:hypothetical protein